MVSDFDAREGVVPRGDMTLRLDGPLAQSHRALLIGDGAELVVFSHGMGTDQTAWLPVARSLPERFSALLFDLPGAGPLQPAEFEADSYDSIARFADDFLDLLDEIGVARCRFVGHSIAGMIGILAAIEDPARFDQLLLLNYSPCYLNDGDYRGGFEREQLDGLLDAMASDYPGWVAGFVPRAIAANAPGAIEEFSRGLLAMRPDITLRIARTIFESDLRPLLGRLSVPTVLIHSRADVIVPGSVAEYMQRQIVKSRLLWIEAEGHLPHLSAPHEVARAIADHLG